MKYLIDKLIEKHMNSNMKFPSLGDRKTVSTEYGNKIKQEEKQAIASYRTAE